MELKNLLLITFLFLIGQVGFAQVNNTVEKEWILAKDTEDVQVYTRKTENSEFKEIRIHAVFNANIDTFFYKLNNPITYADWVYKCTLGKTLNKINEDEFYYYTVVDLPFPVKDRDMIVKCKQWKDENGTRFSHSVAVPDFIPHENNFVRIPYFESDWIVSPLPDGMIQVDYTALADPGGSIPVWIVNLAVTSGPLKTMEQLIASVVRSEEILTKQ